MTAIDAEVGAVDLQVDQLAAIHAALNTEAADWQHDVILSAAVGVLASRDLTCLELARTLNRMWSTDAISTEVVESALARGKAMNLLVTQGTLDGATRWCATAGARDDVSKDLEWARWVVRNFEQAVVARFAEAEVSLAAHRRTTVPALMLQSLAVGAQSGYAIEAYVQTDYLRPANFDHGAANRWLDSNITPATVLEQCKALVLAALNPLDEFGSEVLHLIVLGHLARGVMARHDVGTTISLGQTRLLLDTSVLVDLIDEGEVAQTQILRVIELTHRLGGEVVVATHTIAEWERLWQAADAEQPQQVVDAEALPQNAEYLVGNKFAQVFVRMRLGDPAVTWVRFQIGRRDIRPHLLSLGVNVRDAGNSTNEDQQLEVDACAEIERLDAERHVARHRRHTAAMADGASLAMVARWRRKLDTTPSAGYFCARDALTGLAYANLIETDPMALTVNPEGWLLFLARAITGDVAEKLQLAAVVGSNLVRESFFGLAVGFSVADAVRLASLLEEKGRLGADDLQAIVQMELEEVFNEPAASDDRVNVLADRALRRRSQGRDDRAQRLHKSAVELRAAAEAAEQRVASTLLAKDRHHENELATLVTGKDEERDSERNRSGRIQRGLVTALITVVAVAGMALAWWWRGVPPTGGIVLDFAAIATILWTGIDATVDVQKPWSRVVLGATGGLVFAVLGATVPTASGPVSPLPPPTVQQSTSTSPPPIALPARSEAGSP